MTVVRSLAFQNARKSTGQSTYYRRKGVQLVRSKPTFPPDRKFTELQKQSQQKMAIAQYVAKEIGLQSIANCCNTAHKKRYNASTQLNVLVSRLIDTAKGVDYYDNKTAQEIVMSEGIWTMYKYAVGNIIVSGVGFEIENWANLQSGYLNMKVFIPLYTLNSMVREANKRIRTKKPLTMLNVGVCGAVCQQRTSGADSIQNFVALLPTLCSGGQESTEHSGEIELDFKVIAATSAGFLSGKSGDVAMNLFITNEDSTDKVVGEKMAIFSTYSIFCESVDENEYNELENWIL